MLSFSSSIGDNGVDGGDVLVFPRKFNLPMFLVISLTDVGRKNIRGGGGLCQIIGGRNKLSGGAWFLIIFGKKNRTGSLMLDYVSWHADVASVFINVINKAVSGDLYFLTNRDLYCPRFFFLFFLSFFT